MSLISLGFLNFVFGFWGLHSHYIRTNTMPNNTFRKTSLQKKVKLKEMIKCIKHRLINIFSFSEKAGRLDFIFTTIGLVIFVAVGFFLYRLIFDFLWGGFPSLFQIIFFFGVFLLIPNICRRLNDLAVSRLAFLLLFVPIVNMLFELYLIFMPGKKNK